MAVNATRLRLAGGIELLWYLDGMIAKSGTERCEKVNMGDEKREKMKGEEHRGLTTQARRKAVNTAGFYCDGFKDSTMILSMRTKISEKIVIGLIPYHKLKLS